MTAKDVTEKDSSLTEAPDHETIPEASSVTLALVSHTNVGKTTLARTLLRRDVGEVLDRAHVTEESERFDLLEAAGERLMLWDTPGFGDSARLLRRLRTEEKPVLWFLQQTWDRLTDRPLYSSQRAAITVREDADVVLYLVNATELPEEAGYVDPELELLGWLGRPVVVVLNQTGEASLPPSVVAARREAWRRHTVERHEVVKDVVLLDAFSRSWVQETLLLDRLAPWLDASKQAVLERLEVVWRSRNLEVFDRALDAMAHYLATVARDREALPSKNPNRDEKKQAMTVLADRLEQHTRTLMTALLEIHGLSGTAAAEVERQVDAYAVEGLEAIDPERGALFGGVISGALGGLTADLLSGGLTFGGGMVAGAILGALGGAGLARGYQMVTAHKRPLVGWTAPFLDRLTAQTLLRYLAVAHFGRGRGSFELRADEPERWRDAVSTTLAIEPERWAERWQVVTRREEERAEATALLRRGLDDATRRVLTTAYPDAKELLDS
ncbi:MAG: DUF3482 domain-containing protein [Acidobacteriota bacterium]